MSPHKCTSIREEGLLGEGDFCVRQPCTTRVSRELVKHEPKNSLNLHKNSTRETNWEFV